MPQREPIDDRRARGISLVETLTAIAITAIVTGMSVPSFRQSVARQRVEGRTAELIADLAFARQEAMTRNSKVRVGFRTNSQGGCYVMHTGTTGDCVCSPMAQTQCKNGAIEIRTAAFPSTQSIVLQPPKDFLFAPPRGTATPTATITLEVANGISLKASVAQTGRVSVCTPDISTLTGYKQCKI